jgi:hypothetical protein
MSSPSKAPSCVVLSNKPYCVMEASADFAALFGYCPDHIKGRSLQLLHGPDSGNTSIDDLLKALKLCKQQKSEMLLYKKDGTRLQVSVNVSCRPPTCDMDSVAVVSVMLSGSPYASGDIDDYEDSKAILQDSVKDCLNTQKQSLQRVKCGQEKVVKSDVRSEAILGQLRIVLSRASCQVFSIPCSRSYIYLYIYSSLTPLELYCHCLHLHVLRQRLSYQTRRCASSS